MQAGIRRMSEMDIVDSVPLDQRREEEAVSPLKAPRTIGQRLLQKLADGPLCGSTARLHEELGCTLVELHIVRRELRGEERLVEVRCPADARRVVLMLPGSAGCGHVDRFGIGFAGQERP
jgi:hypothetical protein